MIKLLAHGEDANAALLHYLAGELGDRSDGRLVGRLSESLGLAGSIDLDSSLAIFQDGMIAGENIFPKVQCRGAGVIFAAPKSISTLAVLSPDARVREAVEEAWQIAVVAGLETLDAAASVSRVGKGGAASMQTNGLLIWQEYQPHLVSGDGSPHLHSHFIVANATRAAGKWRGLDTDVLMAANRYAEAAVQIKLYDELQARFGSLIKWDEIKQCPMFTPTEPASDLFSQRGKAARIVGGTSAQRYAAWRATRAGCEKFEREIHAMIFQEDRDTEKWRDDLSQTAKLSRSDLVPQLQQSLPEDVPIYSSSHAASIAASADNRYAVLTLSADAGALTIGEIVGRAMLTFKTDLDSARNIVAACLRSAAAAGELATEVGDDLIYAVEQGFSIDTKINRLAGVGKMSAKKIILTADVDAERAFVRRVRQLASAKKAALKIAVPAHFSSEQAQVLAVLAQHRGLTAISGVAGAGKSTALKPFVAAVGAENVLVTCRNSNTALDLGTSLGVPAISIAGLQTRMTAEKLVSLRGKTVIVDEAGLVDRSDWDYLLDCAEKYTWSLVTLGDRMQNAAIDRRPTWALITEGAAAASASVELTESWRNASWASEARALRDRDGATAVKYAAAEGRVLGVDEEGLQSLLISLSKQYRDSVILTKTNALAQLASEAIQASRRSELGSEVAWLDWMDTGYHQHCYIGDKIRFRVNKYDKGQLRWTNGQVGEVVGEQFGRVIVKIGPKHRIAIKPDELRTHAELAYATTGNAAQGISVEQAISIGTGMTEHDKYSTCTRSINAPIHVVVMPKSFGTWTQDDVLAQLTQQISTPTTVATLQEEIDLQAAQEIATISKQARIEYEKSTQIAL